MGALGGGGGGEGWQEWSRKQRRLQRELIYNLDSYAETALGDMSIGFLSQNLLDCNETLQ